MLWANHAARYVDIFNKFTTKDLKAYNVPQVFLCYCSERCYKIIDDTAREKYHLNGQTPHTLMSVQPTDISAIYESGWYDWCYYRYTAAKLQNSAELLGRFLGPADHAGTAMYQWEMNENGIVLPLLTLRSLNVGEINSGT